MKTTWLTAVCAMAFLFLHALPGQAQSNSLLEEKDLPVGAFSAISATDNYEITLVRGACGVKITVDQQLMPYTQVYVRAKTLYITYDEKSVPKDIRKLYKGKSAPTPVFRAVVSMPELNGITLTDNATLTSTAEMEGNRFDLSLTDKAQVKNLILSAQAATVTMKKNALAVLHLETEGTVDLNDEGNANLKADVKAQDLIASLTGSATLNLTAQSVQTTLRCSGSSKLLLSGETQKMDLQAGGSSDVGLSGTAETFLIKAEKNADIEANAFKVNKVEADLSGSAEAYVSVSDLLDVKLVGGSALYYTGSPEFRIGKVVKSTLAPYGTK